MSWNFGVIYILLLLPAVLCPTLSSMGRHNSGNSMVITLAMICSVIITTYIMFHPL